MIPITHLPTHAPRDNTPDAVGSRSDGVCRFSHQFCIDLGFTHTETQRGRVVDGLWTEARGQQKPSNDPHDNQHNPQYANRWAPLTRKRHILPAQPQHTNYWAPRTRKRHQREHRPQRPTERSDPTQHAKGRPGDCPGPRKETTTRRNVTQGGGGGSKLGCILRHRCPWERVRWGMGRCGGRRWGCCRSPARLKGGRGAAARLDSTKQSRSACASRGRPTHAHTIHPPLLHGPKGRARQRIAGRLKAPGKSEFDT